MTKKTASPAKHQAKASEGPKEDWTTPEGLPLAGESPVGRRRVNANAPAPAELADTFAVKSLMLPYQRRWVEDPSRFLVGVWGRQTGKSFSTAYIVAASMVREKNSVWMIAAPSERQSLEALAKVKDHLRAFRYLFEDVIQDLAGTEEKASGVSLPNGSRCIAVPGKPDTVRGMSANVWLDEFAFFESPDATWKAILPSIVNPLRGGEKRVIITSTPNGRAGQGERFFKICSGLSGGGWSVHRVPLRSAIADGLPLKYEDIASAMNDPLAVAQELDAEFVDAQGQLLSTEIILRSESEQASMSCPPDIFDGRRDIRVGIDIGRVSDPTVVWSVEKIGDVLMTREVLILSNMSHVDQLSYIRARVRGARRVCMDYTGMGIGIGDSLVREFGQYKPAAHLFRSVELCSFSAAFKREIFPRLRESMEGAKLRIPRSDALRSDFAAMSQISTASGYSYEAPRTRDGHSDSCTAAALAVRAASGDVAAPLPSRLPSASSRGGFGNRFVRRLRGAFRKSSNV